MQDRYAGDIGDYGKIALLKELHNQGLSIGVNWYRTEPVASEKKANGYYKQNDGGFSIPSKLKECDPVLAEKLTEIFNSKDRRSIHALERASLIPDAVFFSEPVPVESREDWHARALDFFQKNRTDLVFLDPDNGLLVPSVKKENPRSVKYAFYEEVADYLCQGHSVLIYNHRSRKTELQYFCEIESRLRGIIPERMHNTEIFEITFPRFSVRDYFAIPASPEHANRIRIAFSTMLSGKWIEKRMCQKPITAGATYSEYRARFKSKNDFLKHYRSLPKETIMEMIKLTGANITVKACMASIWNSNR